MNKFKAALRPWYKLVLLFLCCAVTFGFYGYFCGRKSVEADYQTLADNILGARYWVELSYAGADDQRESLVLLCGRHRFPHRVPDGLCIRTAGVPFIERKYCPYDISSFALTNGKSSEGFDFTFVGAPEPDHIMVQRWPREQQGTVGTFTNGEPVDFVPTTQDLQYHISQFEPGYIYSIYALWGPYYGEYGVLVSTQESDRQFWRVDRNA